MCCSTSWCCVQHFLVPSRNFLPAARGVGSCSRVYTQEHTIRWVLELQPLHIPVNFSQGDMAACRTDSKRCKEGTLQ
jgi:hypothetical protein